MDKVRNHTIKMTDHQYETLRQMAVERKLSIGKFIEEVCSEYNAHTNEIKPEILCRLLTIRNFMNVPQENWNREMKVLFVSCVEDLCALLKW